MRAPGPLLASGRDADIFDYGPGAVLRRSRDGRSLAGEARVMEYVRQHGYPVPAVEELSDDGAELAMERINGPSMGDYLRRRPWSLRHQGATLARLHLQLHDIAPPDFLSPAPVGRGEGLVHLDLHPLNVLIGPAGPVVIDWSGAAHGDPDVDVGLAWVLMAAGEVEIGRVLGAVLGRLRAVLVRSFLVPFDLDPVKGKLREIVAWKVGDPHMSLSEQQAMWRVVEEAEASR